MQHHKCVCTVKRLRKTGTHVHAKVLGTLVTVPWTWCQKLERGKSFHPFSFSSRSFTSTSSVALPFICIPCLSLITQVQAFSFIWPVRNTLHVLHTNTCSTRYKHYVMSSTEKSVASIRLFTYSKAKKTQRSVVIPKSATCFHCLIRSRSPTTLLCWWLWGHSLIPAVWNSFFYLSFVWLLFFFAVCTYNRQPKS